MSSRVTGRNVRSLACGLLAAVAAGSVAAQSPAQGLLTDSFVFSLGTFIVNSDVSARLDGRSTQNPEIDFDKTFGRDDDATRVRFDGLWRINPAHHVRFMYFDNSRNAARSVSNLKWGDYTFSGQVDSEFKQSTSALIYEYAFMRAPEYELAGTFGIHYSKVSLKLAGTATLTNPDGSVTTAQPTSRAESVPAPLPIIGLRAGWAVAPNWHIDAEAQFFKIDYDGINGNWADVRLAGTWMFARNYGVGLGYNRFTTRTDVNKGTFNGTLKTGYSGLQLFMTGSF